MSQAEGQLLRIRRSQAREGRNSPPPLSRFPYLESRVFLLFARMHTWKYLQCGGLGGQGLDDKAGPSGPGPGCDKRGGQGATGGSGVTRSCDWSRGRGSQSLGREKSPRAGSQLGRLSRCPRQWWPWKSGRKADLRCLEGSAWWHLATARTRLGLLQTRPGMAGFWKRRAAGVWHWGREERLVATGPRVRRRGAAPAAVHAVADTGPELPSGHQGSPHHSPGEARQKKIKEEDNESEPWSKRAETNPGRGRRRTGEGHGGAGGSQRPRSRGSRWDPEQLPHRNRRDPEGFVASHAHQGPLGVATSGEASRCWAPAARQDPGPVSLAVSSLVVCRPWDTSQVHRGRDF